MILIDLKNWNDPNQFFTGKIKSRHAALQFGQLF